MSTKKSPENSANHAPLEHAPAKGAATQGNDAAANHRKAADSSTPASGTHILPMPDIAQTVAGMPRDKRVLTEPGDPGVPAPEDQVNGGVPPDTRPE